MILTVIMIAGALPLAELQGLDFVLPVKAAATYKTGDVIKFGTYPQSRVTDETLIAKLDAVEKTWASYGYYSGTDVMNDGEMTPGDFMLFADFFFEGNKYRAVSIEEYRPKETDSIRTASRSYQGEHGYAATLGKQYYFEYAPLSWRVLDASTGFVLCENIIDAQAFQNTTYSDDIYRCYQTKDCNLLANDYTSSSIRDWLNKDFFRVAFTASQQSNMQTVTIENDPTQGYERYYSGAKNDKIFFLSLSDVQNTGYGFSESAPDYDPVRLAQGTDYAKCQGLEYNGSTDDHPSWWLRSSGRGLDSAYYVNYLGAADCDFRVCDASFGVRPACVLKNLYSDIACSDLLFSQLIVTENGGTTNYKPTGSEQNTYRYIEFGSYPQGQVTDSATVSKLEKVKKTWKSYGYYCGTSDVANFTDSLNGKMTPDDFMLFSDFFFEGAKYRAVYIGEYRPYCTSFSRSEMLSMQDENGFVSGQTYYYQYEPLKWRVLDANKGIVLCENIIDAQPFNNTVYHADPYSFQIKMELWQDDTKTHYANDYSVSSVRDWLNGAFYETAFSGAQKTNIKKTTLENPAFIPVCSMFDSLATNDKVFLLSWSDMFNKTYGFSEKNNDDPARMASGTDYAKCQGLYGRSGAEKSNEQNSWLLRTSGSISAGSCFVSDYGNLDDFIFTFETDIGIRPACVLENLKSDATISDTLFSETGNPAGTPEQISVAEHKKHYYTVITDEMLWEEAEAYCEQRGGHLVTIADVAENDFVYELLPDGGLYWLGGTDKETEGEWKWVTGEPWDYTNWHSGEPNNGLGGGEQDYTQIYGNWNGFWDDAWNDQNNPFVCEWDSLDAATNCVLVIEKPQKECEEHTFGEWEYLKVPNYHEGGQAQHTCDVCGYAETRDYDPVTPDIIKKDENTGVAIGFMKDTYEADVDLKVANGFDGAAYSVLCKEKTNFRFEIYDIATLMNEEPAQPSGKVLVKLPIPADYSRDRLAVCCVTDDNTVETMELWIEDDYACFEAERLGTYALVDESAERIRLGDVDVNGKIESADARLALRCSVKLENYAIGSIPFRAGDVDFDGKVSSADARTILRVSVKLEQFGTN